MTAISSVAASSSVGSINTISAIGGLYAGVVDGHAIFLQPGQISNASWEDCAAFAAAAGGSLPTHQEVVALGAMGLKLTGPYWMADRANGDRALAFSFLSGLGGYSHTSNEFNGLVVRRELVAPVESGDGADADTVAAGMLDAELWPEDSELLGEIRDLFLQKWGMHAGQADIRMARFNYQAAHAALEGGAA